MISFFGSIMKLNIGAENDYKEGWVNLDFDRRFKADVYWDLNNFPYPFKDNTFEEILASAVLEHVDNFYKVMRELHRISKDKAKIYILLPHGSDVTLTWGEVEHKRGFSIHTFGSIWCNKELWNLFEVKKRKITFSIKYKIANSIINPLVNLSPVFYERIWCHYLPCSDVVFVLEVIKDKQLMDIKTRELYKFDNQSRKKYNMLKFIKEL